MSRLMRSVWRAFPSAPAVATASVLLSAVLAGCAAEPIGVSTPHIKGTLYLRHNLRCAQDGLTKIAFNSNYLSFPELVKAGTPVNIFLFSAERLDMTVEDLQLRMFHHEVAFPTDQSSIGNFIDKHFARNRKEVDDLRAAVSPDSRNAADNGKVQLQMNKEEVVFAVGYPALINGVQPADLLTREQILNANQWVYYNSKPWYLFGLGQERWVLEFDVENKLRTVIR